MILSSDLVDDLLPFSMCFSAEGKVLSMSRLLRAVWEVDEEGSAGEFSDKLTMARPFIAPFDATWLPELTDLILHFHPGEQVERTVRGQLFPHNGGWLFTGFPLVSSINDLEALGIQLSSLPLHVSAGDLLIAAEASASSLHESKRLSQRLVESNAVLEQLNQRFECFVPTVFLEDIGVRTPLEAELGRHAETRKAVMFADLRQFTTISEQVEASRIFEVINGYLQSTVPCIEAHGGYVVQYLGDGIMALFPGEDLAALRAAIDMQDALKAYAADIDGLAVPLRMSIGIHEGPVALGIVGHETRWDASIIADAVNTSARIESMTRILGGEIIVSQHFLDSSSGSEAFAQRALGTHEIRGRKGHLALVEILDSLDVEVRNYRLETQADFSEGLEAYRNGDLYQSMSCFSRVLSRVPRDLAAQFYLARISERLRSLPS
jgi:class 3 adenylate cyclase